jgi:hypothetical protein
MDRQLHGVMSGGKMKKNLTSHFSKTIFATCYYLLVVFPIVVSAADVSLQWDASVPAPDGYRLYVRQSGEAFDYTNPVWDGTTTTQQVEDLTPGITYFFIVRAYVENEESSNSNEVEYTPSDSGSSETPDNDGDGVDNSIDAFPDDAYEWLDTDSDGIGNNADTDDDGDGMPDSWEAQYEGLNPLVNDAQNDLDGDGIANLDEYYADSDPSVSIENSMPDQPELVAPENESIVALSPDLTTGVFIDADGDAHKKTQYQIAITSDFDTESLVYDCTSDTQLTSLTVADLVLDPETDYFWRARFFDEHNGSSEWSETLSFTTMGYDETGDADGDGVIDDQKVDGTVDMDQDGTADVVQNGILSVRTPCSINPWIAVKSNTDNADIVSIRAYTSSGFGPADNAPEQMTGLVSFKLYLDPGVTETSVTVYFYEAAPADARWYKYDAETGWSAYANAYFSADRKSVTISLEDGGIGDQDGVRNGIIVDPAGLGYSIYSDDGPSSVDTGSVGAGAGGCFISSPMNEWVADTVMSNLYSVFFVSLCLASLLIACRYLHMKKP